MDPRHDRPVGALLDLAGAPGDFPEDEYERDAYINENPHETLIQRWSAKGKLLGKRKIDPLGAQDVAFDGARRVYLGWSDAPVSMVDLAKKKQPPVSIGRLDSGVAVLSLSPDGTQLAAEEDDGSISVWATPK